LGVLSVSASTQSEPVLLPVESQPLYTLGGRSLNLASASICVVGILQSAVT